jgi:hypothetical protein
MQRESTKVVLDSVALHRVRASDPPALAGIDDVGK